MKDRGTAPAYLEKYYEFKNREISGRYLHAGHLEPVLEELGDTFLLEQEGSSERGVPIFSLRVGTGPIKILAWSQMHGNETTTTKAVLDVLNLFRLHSEEKGVSDILDRCSIKIIPMLNPDGAALYTRENANGVDLNRDAHLRTQMESQVLMKVYEDVKPDFCFNLHDQRTIFSAGPVPKPASISFLAPAFDEQRSLNENRKKAMQVIVTMNESLQKVLPGQIGRYDDGFNINCTGDTFQSLGVSTILFEAGHIAGDYQREETRKYMGYTIFLALSAISKATYMNAEIGAYHHIPENQKNFFDILLRNAQIDNQKKDVAIQYQEKLEQQGIIFIPQVQFLDDKLHFYGHQTINCKNEDVNHLDGKTLAENDIVAAILLNKKHISFKIE